MRIYSEITKSLRRWGIVFLLLVLIAILVFSILFAGRIRINSRRAQVIPISLQSHLAADYRSNPIGVEIPVLEIGLIEEAILDQRPNDGGASEQADEIVSELLTPVPSITPTPTVSPTSDFNPTTTPGGTSPTAGPSSTATSPAAASATPSATSPSSHTPTASATLPPGTTATSTYTPTSTATIQTSPSATASRTATNPAPSATATFTATASYTPSFTPTRVPSATPTNTPTPAGNICGSIVVSGFRTSRKQVRWTITNNSSQTIMITQIFFDWPLSNDKLKKIKLDHWVIWDEKDSNPPTSIITSWSGSSFRREIRPGENEDLVFDFDENTAIFGYFLRLTFNGTCMIEVDR